MNRFLYFCPFSLYHNTISPNILNFESLEIIESFVDKTYEITMIARHFLILAKSQSLDGIKSVPEKYSCSNKIDLLFILDMQVPKKMISMHCKMVNL